MTRWARGGTANKKKKNDASTWQELNDEIDTNDRKSKMSETSQKIVTNLRKIQKSNDPKVDSKAIEAAVKREVKSEHRRVVRIEKKEDSRICFACRKTGHPVSECPEAKKLGNEVANLCFKCGSTEHSISTCRAKGIPASAFPYATCFICKKTGHLSKQCVENPRGLYPDGGSCRLCGSTEHFRKDCPDLTEASRCNLGDVITLSCISKDVFESMDDEPSLYLTNDDKEDENDEQDEQEAKQYKPVAKRKAAKVVIF